VPGGGQQHDLCAPDMLWQAVPVVGLDHVDVLIARAGRRACVRARQRGRARRHGHRHGRLGRGLRHGAADGLAVISPLRCHQGDRAENLLEQRADLGCLAVLVARQLGREDVAAAPCRALASWWPCSAPEGSCGGARHRPCMASLIRRTSERPDTPSSHPAQAPRLHQPSHLGQSNQ